MWIIITLIATISQTLRNAFSKKISKTVSAEAVSLARFLYALPVTIAVYFIAKNIWGEVDISSNSFFYFIFLFAIFQALATFFFAALFNYKNFAVSVTFIKTEIIFVAILGILFLNEQIAPLGWIGMLISFLGLILATFAKSKIKLNNFKKAFQGGGVYLGLLSALSFSIAVVLIKHAMSFLETDILIMKSIFALLITLIIQVSFMLPITYLKNKNSLVAIIKNPLFPFLSGLTSSFASIFWFWAYSLTNVAYVKVVGQVEFILSILISVFLFKEKIYKNEYIGMALIILGVIILILL